MKTIAFDLDGTLIDISERDYRIYSDVLLELGYKPIEKGIYWPQRRNITDIHWILEQSGCTDENDVNYFLQKRKEKMEELYYLKMDNLFADTIDTLNTLGNSYHLVILTRRLEEDNTRKQCEWLGLDKKTELRIVKGDKKEQMRAIPNLCAFIGDTENDILPANELGVMSIAVTTGIRNENKLKELHPAMIINTLSEVINIKQI